MNLAPSPYDFLFPLEELSIFHLREALYSFGMVYMNYQQHYACTLGPLLSAIRDAV